MRVQNNQGNTPADVFCLRAGYRLLRIEGLSDDD